MKLKIRANIVRVLDIILVNVSLALAYFLRFSGDYGKIPSDFLKDAYLLAIIATVVKIGMYMLFKLYSSLWRYASVYEMISIVGAAFFSNGIMTGYIVLTNTRPWSIFVFTFFIDIFLIGGLRFGYRAFRRIIRGEMVRMKDSKRVLVIGGGDAGAIVIKELKQHPELNSVPVGIIDDDMYKKGRKINGVSILGGRKEILDTINKKSIDEVIIAIPSASKKDLNEIYNECAKSHCKIKILPSVAQLIDESVVMQKIRDVNIEDLLGREQVKLNSSEVASYVNNQVILVTGGGGSIGSELCRQIAEYKPKQLIILDNYENSLYDIQNELLFLYPGLDLVSVVANIREKQRIESIFAKYKPNVVFHAAAHKHVPLMEANPAEAIKNNVFGTMNIAECSDKYNVKRFVLISTDKAVNPTNIMGATKRIAEMIVQAINAHSKTEFVAVRFGNVLGSNGSVIPLFKKQIEQGGPVTVTHPGIIRYFMTIPEAVQLVMQAGSMANGGEIFVLDMGQPVKILDLAVNLIRLSGLEPNEDIKIVFTGLRPGEKLYEELLLAEEGLETTVNHKIFVAQPVFTDLALLRREIDYLKEIVVSDADKIFDYIKSVVPTYKKAN
ncbi:MAG TPA: nucleoside-diphosphate sugar epimerase/dehydratase [Clostridia bacterium]|nr:nucleoside-diphosphate sugar epimerase/dehydratase [Clostridia bacterium]